MEFIGDTLTANVPRQCYLKKTRYMTYSVEHRNCAIEVPSSCFHFGDLGQVYCCTDRSPDCTAEEVKNSQDPRFQAAVTLLRRLKSMCFKQIILPCSYQLWKAAYCAGWDIENTILLLDHDAILSAARTEDREHHDTHPYNPTTAMAIGVDRLLRDMNSIFQTGMKPRSPYTVTVDEPSKKSAGWSVPDLKAIYLLIHDQIGSGNPYYLSQNRKGVSFDVSDYTDFFPGDSTKYCDHFVYNKYDVDRFTYGRTFTGSPDQSVAWRDIKEEGGWQVRGAYINLLSDRGEYENLFQAAARLSFSDMWVFPGENSYWDTKPDCDEFIALCEQLCTSAKRSGYGLNDDRQITVPETYYAYCSYYPHCERCTTPADYQGEPPAGFPPIMENEGGYNPFIR